MIQLPDPVAWCEHFLGDKLWSTQKEVLRASLTCSRIAIKAGHSVGKTSLAARIALFHLIHATDGAMLMTTAPTFRQVQDLLWREMRQCYRRSVFLGRPISWKPPAPRGPRWIIDPDEPEGILALGVATNNPDNLQGYHDRHLVAIIDEAAGVEEWVWGQILSFKPKLLLAIGNPTDPESEFAKCFDSERWQCYTIPVFESPNFTGEAEQIWGGPSPVLCDREWVDEVRERFGEDSPYWKSRVLAEFPSEGADALLPASFYDAQIRPCPAPHRWCAFGIDLAELGGDQSIVTVWHEGVLAHLIPLPPADLMATVGRIVLLIDEHKPDCIGVDDTGLVGVSSRLRELANEKKWIGTNGDRTIIMPIVPGSGCTTDDAKTRYLNLRAEMAWEMREDVRNGLCGFARDWPRLREEGRKTTYDVVSSGKIQLERKDDIRERIHRSPDSLDSAMYGWHAQRECARRFALKPRTATRAKPTEEQAAYFDPRRQGAQGYPGRTKRR